MTAVAAAAALAAAVGAVGGSTARADVGDNAVVAINTHDGSTKFRIAFAVRRVNKDVVDSGNAAVAVASCTSCQTVAIAIEALLITGDPSVVSPTNLAFAYNVECNECETLATAYQTIFTTGGPVHFTADGNRRLAQVRVALERLRTADLDIFELQTRVDALAADVYDIVKNELVLVGKMP